MKSETVKSARKADLMDCPGAWYGWQPKADCSGCGHVVIDPKDTIAALAWLKRRYWVAPRNTTTDGGLLIDLQIRPVKAL